MKYSLASRIMMIGAALALAIPAFAGGSVHKGNVAFADPVQINGKQIPAGEYRVTWEGDGPSVNLHILRNGKEVASAPATVKQLDSKAPGDAAESRSSSGGSRELTAIRFAGKTYELNLGSTTSQSDSKSGDSVK